MSDRNERREANMQERIAAGLHPKLGNQSLSEERRILGTWTKADLIGFYLRTESDELWALDRAIASDKALREHREQSLTLTKRPIRDSTKTPDQKRAYEEWLHRNKGRGLIADDIFLAGWTAALTITETNAANTAEESN